MKNQSPKNQNPKSPLKTKTVSEKPNPKVQKSKKTNPGNQS